MTRIRVNTKVLEHEANKIKGVGASTISVGRSLVGATQGAPSYDGQFAPVVQSISANAQVRAKGMSGRLGDFEGKLNATADAFEAADMVTQTAIETAHQWQGNIGKSIYSTSEWVVNLIPAKWRPYLEGAGESVTFAEGVFAAGAAIKILRMTHSGSSYSGQVIIPGGHTLKELSGVRESLTHIKLGGSWFSQTAKISGHMRKAAWKGAWKDAANFKGISGKLKLLDLGFKWGQDIIDYRDEGATKVVSAIAVDTALTVTASAVGGAGGAAIGSWVGGIIGGAVGSIIPGAGTVAGAAAGSFIGGAVGRVAGAWGAEKLANQELGILGDQSIRDAAIDMVSTNLDTVVSVGEGIISTAAQAIDKNLHNTTKAVTDLFAPLAFGY